MTIVAKKSLVELPYFLTVVKELKDDPSNGPTGFFISQEERDWNTSFGYRCIYSKWCIRSKTLWCPMLYRLLLTKTVLIFQLDSNSASRAFTASRSSETISWPSGSSPHKYTVLSINMTVLHDAATILLRDSVPMPTWFGKGTTVGGNGSSSTRPQMPKSAHPKATRNCLLDDLDFFCECLSTDVELALALWW